MATDDEDKNYRQGLVDVVRELSQQLIAVSESLGSVREQVARDLADYLARYREDGHRAIMALATRIIRIEDAFQKDAEERQKRQGEVDTVFAAIRADIEAIRNSQRGRNWQQWAQLILLVLLLVVMGALLWQLR